MNWQKIIESMISNLSWPLTILILVFALKDKLQKIEKFKTKEYEVSFLNEVKSIRKDAKNQSRSINKTGWKVTSTEFLRDNMIDLAAMSPVAVVLQAWSIMEKTVVECAVHKGYHGYSSPSSSVQYLYDNEYLLKGLLDLYFRLFTLKERFTNFENEEVTKERALEAADTILSITVDIHNYVANIKEIEDKQILEA